MIRHPPRSPLSSSSAASDVYKRQVYSYPDSSEYGRMVGLSSVRSFAQAGFECTDGVRVIVSFEFYRKPHVWNADEINAFNTVKQVADFCARYIEEH